MALVAEGFEIKRNRPLLKAQPYGAPTSCRLPAADILSARGGDHRSPHFSHITGETSALVIRLLGYRQARKIHRMPLAGREILAIFVFGRCLIRIICVEGKSGVLPREN